jgi:hypothetical protein
MGKHNAISNNRLAGGFLLGALASGTLAVASLSSAGAANATCASFSGVNAGTGCTSTPTSFAVGLGPGTTASAQGVFNGAIAIGNTSFALVNELPNTDPRAGNGGFNLAIAVGNNAGAITRGTGNVALAVGNPGPNAGFPEFGQAGPTHRTFAEASGTFNRAFALGDGSIALANGGNRLGVPRSIGNNTAISLGTGANSYAGAIPAVAGGTTPNNQFAFAGAGMKAINAVVP